MMAAVGQESDLAERCRQERVRKALLAFCQAMKRLARRSKACGIDEKASWYFARVGQVQEVLGVEVEMVPAGCGIEEQSEWHTRWLRDAIKICGRKPSDSARRSAWLWARAVDALARLRVRLNP